MTPNCTSCRAELPTPLVCLACGALQEPAAEPSPFEALGVEPAFDLDVDDLRKRLLRFTRATHPDYFGTAEPAVRRLAERHSARLNGAFETLADPPRRADRLVHDLGGPDEEAERQMPQAFLMEVLEWNEALEEARGAAPGAPERAALAELETTLRAHRADVLEALGAGLTPLPERGSPALLEARRRLNALRYLDRALRELDALRLEEAAR